MPVKWLEAGPVSARLEPQLAQRIAGLRKKGIQPRLDIVLVGDDAASQVYVAKKIEAGRRLGIDGQIHAFPERTSAEEVQARVEKLNQAAEVHGILIQRPLPAHFAEAAIDTWIAPEKDVDCFHPVNVGLLQVGTPLFLPCTPAGILKLLDHYRISVAGRIACVLGRSAIVGKPLAHLLVQRDATLIHCHSKTRSLPKLTRQADLIFVAVGRRHFLRKAWVKKGAIVIDVGIHRLARGGLTGDVHPEVASTARAITPVPGGVGPMTILSLLSNTVEAASLRSH